jgi:hypothetical protein
MNYINFFLFWLAVNVGGFTVGSLLGATTGGLIPSIIPGLGGLILGDLIYGGLIGLAQSIVIKKFDLFRVPALWIIATAVGFMLGARFGAKFTYALVTQIHLPPSIIFGAFMGGGVGFTTAGTFRHILSPVQLTIWLVINILAWMLGEGIAFYYLFSQIHVPLVALGVASITGIGLVLLSKLMKYPAGRNDASASFH